MIRENGLGAKVLISTNFERNTGKWLVSIKSPSGNFMTLHNGSYKCDEKQAIEKAWIEYNYSLLNYVP